MLPRVWRVVNAPRKSHWNTSGDRSQSVNPEQIDLSIQLIIHLFYGKRRGLYDSWNPESPEPDC